VSGGLAVSQRYGLQRRRIGRLHFHSGIDLPRPIGAPVYAVEAGTVRTGVGRSAGRWVQLRAGGRRWWYLHLMDWAVRSGRVQRGQILGWVGMTGNTTGPHLHFALTDARGRYHDPTRRYMPGTFRR
jgi:murein DD-endopeptidase MepM/ murein hydrolase activator NlpD